MLNKKPLKKSPRQPSNSKSKKNKKEKRLTLKSLARWIVIGGIWSAIGVGFILLFFAYDLPDATQLENATRRPGVILKARDGTILATYGDLYGQTVKVETLPRHISEALLAVEDSRFYYHIGIDFIGLIRAIYANYRAGQVVQGGSTITQQLAKNFLFSEKRFNLNDRSIRRKVQELILALWLEYKFTKKQILTIYLNRVYFGAGTYGISAASQKYFGKMPEKLTVYEAAVIAGLLKAPSRYSPLSDPAKANERAQIVLNRMVEAGFITASERKSLKDSQTHMTELNKAAVFGRYFADWIIEQVWSYAQNVNEDLVVETTFDPRLQRLAEVKLEDALKKNGQSSHISQGALVAMTPNGAVRAMVGGSDYRKSQFNRASQALRQPGSAFKLFVFLAALEKGISLKARISDAPIKIGKWSPKNFGWTSKGNMSFEEAFAYSINTCAVRIAQVAGPKAIAKVAQRLGISEIKTEDLSIALGTSETTLLELTSAFGVIANNGFKVEPYGILSIKDRKGNLIYLRKKLPPPRLISKENTLALLKLMQAVIHYGTGKNTKVDRPAAGKSGTTQKHKDAWFIGFTADLVTGVWLGNDDGSVMIKISGGNLPALIWGDYMRDAHQGYPIHGFPSS